MRDSVFTGYVPTGANRPGKGTALARGDPSRVPRRGRLPAAPASFLKPRASVSASGRPVQLPGGAEQLSFDAEIALMPGARVRNVSVDNAWLPMRAVVLDLDGRPQPDVARTDRRETDLMIGADGFSGTRCARAKEEKHDD